MKKLKTYSFIFLGIFFGIVAIVGIATFLHATLQTANGSIATFHKSLWNMQQIADGVEQVTVNGYEQAKLAFIWIVSIVGSLLFLGLVLTITLLVVAKKKKIKFNTDKYNQFDIKEAKKEYKAQRKDTALGYKIFKKDLLECKKNSKKKK